MILRNATVNANQAGFTLLEIVISLFVLSLLLFGMDAMQYFSRRETFAAYYYSQAISQLNVLHEEIKTQPGQSLNVLLEDWNQQNQAVLPRGKGWVQGRCPACDIIITWGDSQQLRWRHVDGVNAGISHGAYHY